jgi:DNA integrity scanning protein DisA with diadenylate cyclase activity
MEKYRMMKHCTLITTIIITGIVMIIVVGSTVTTVPNNIKNKYNKMTDDEINTKYYLSKLSFNERRAKLQLSEFPINNEISAEEIRKKYIKNETNTTLGLLYGLLPVGVGVVSAIGLTWFDFCDNIY